MTQPIGRREAIKYALAAALLGGITQQVLPTTSDLGPNSPSLTGAFINRFPANKLLTRAQPTSGDNRLIDYTLADDNPLDLAKQWITVFRFKSGVQANKAFFGINDSGMVALNLALTAQPWDPDSSLPIASAGFVGGISSIDFPGSIAVALGSGLDDGVSASSWDWRRTAYTPPSSTEQNGTQRNTRISTQIFDAFLIDTIGRTLFINTAVVNGRPDRFAWREHTTPTNQRNALAADELDQTTGGLAQIGPPTALAGTTNRLADQGHRHAFSGRFIDTAGFLAASVLAGLPLKFARIKNANAWTLRRIWAYSLNGPTGGTESYGIVNAAGTLQGTAVTIPASAGGVSEAESALQVTNLVGGTLYYMAQTATTAAIASTNTSVGIEYTMNV